MSSSTLVINPRRSLITAGGKYVVFAKEIYNRVLVCGTCLLASLIKGSGPVLARFDLAWAKSHGIICMAYRVIQLFLLILMTVFVEAAAALQVKTVAAVKAEPEVNPRCISVGGGGD